jgi:hypothetical protein
MVQGYDYVRSNSGSLIEVKVITEFVVFCCISIPLVPQKYGPGSHLRDVRSKVTVGWLVWPVGIRRSNPNPGRPYTSSLLT